jgi:hypothetical protein
MDPRCDACCPQAETTETETETEEEP